MDRIAPTRRPVGQAPLGYQRWHRLLFSHVRPLVPADGPRTPDWFSPGVDVEVYAPEAVR